MSLPNYQINILSPIDASVTAIYDATAIDDLRYSRALNDIGILAMTLPSTAQNRANFALDSFIEVYREDVNGVLQREETYLTRLMHRFIEGDREQFVVGGLSLNHLMARRIIDPDSDPLMAGGYSTKSGTADQVIYDYCMEQVSILATPIERRVPGLFVGVVAGIGGNVGARLRHENLFEQMQILAKRGAVDFVIERTTGSTLLLSIGVIGADKTRGTNAPLGLPWVGLSPKRGNLTLPSLLKDRKTESNYIYALGQGQADNRLVYKAAGVDIADSPYNRIEFAEDVRNVEKGDVVGLITGGDAALDEHKFKNEFTYQPTGQEPGNVYHIDWDLGDAVTVDWDETTLDLRITGVELAISSEGETISATVSDDFEFPGP